MALVNMREVYPGVSLGLWQMEEKIDELYGLYPWLGAYRPILDKKYKNESRKSEFLSVRVLLHEMLLMVGYTEAQISKIGEIRHNEVGKPLLKGFYISISHTKGYVALVISKAREVAVDIEYLSDRVRRVAPKFLRKDEAADGLDSMLVHWCCKETVYKLFSGENLQFQEMRVKPFDAMADWHCEVENLKSKKKVVVDFELTMEFVLTYAALQGECVSAKK